MFKRDGDGAGAPVQSQKRSEYSPKNPLRLISDNITVDTDALHKVRFYCCLKYRTP